MIKGFWFMYAILSLVAGVVSIAAHISGGYPPVLAGMFFLMMLVMCYPLALSFSQESVREVYTETEKGKE